MNILVKLGKNTHYCQQQVADFLKVPLEGYHNMERTPVGDLDIHAVERLAALYHVSECDLLTGKAVGHSISGDPLTDEELLPFMKFVKNYLMMCRLLDGASTDVPRYRIAWGRTKPLHRGRGRIAIRQ